MGYPHVVPLTLGILISAAAHGEKAKTIFDAELEAGLEYDSTLSVEELDRSTDQSDTARLLKGKLEGQWGATEALTLRGGYSYLGKSYHDNGDFDFDIHQFFGDAAYDLGAFTVGASHHFATAALDGDDLLDLHQSSLYVSRLFDERLFLRLAGNFRDKAFDGRPERDADGAGVDGDVYLFFNEAKSFVSVGISADREDAEGPQFDYEGIGVKAKAHNKFRFLGKPSEVALSYRYTDRDYDSITPEIGAKRNDRRQTTRLEWEVEMVPHLDVVSALEYGDYDSNLDSSNYSESLASVGLRLKL